MAENEVNAPVPRLNAANLVDLEIQRNEILKHEIELEKNGQNVLTDLKSRTNKKFLTVVSAAFSLAISISSLKQALFWLTLVIIIFGDYFRTLIKLAKGNLHSWNIRREYLVRRQRTLASAVEFELGRLNINGNVEGIVGDGPLINLRSFVARAAASGIEFEKINNEINLFVWKKIFHCFLVLLVTSVVIRSGIFDF